jgi:hypothetical protein
LRAAIIAECFIFAGMAVHVISAVPTTQTGTASACDTRMSAIYIQHSHNQAFYYGENRWVLGRNAARCFGGTHEAIAFCLENSLSYAQVRVCFGPGAADTVVPVTRDMQVAAVSPPDAVVW